MLKRYECKQHLHLFKHHHHHHDNDKTNDQVNIDENINTYIKQINLAKSKLEMPD